MTVKTVKNTQLSLFKKKKKKKKLKKIYSNIKTDNSKLEQICQVVRRRSQMRAWYPLIIINREKTISVQFGKYNLFSK